MESVRKEKEGYAYGGKDLQKRNEGWSTDDKSGELMEPMEEISATHRTEWNRIEEIVRWTERCRELIPVTRESILGETICYS